MRGVLEIPDRLIGVQDFVLGALTRVEARFDEQLASELPPVEEMCAHVERYRGKMLRPTLAVLAGAVVRERSDELIAGQRYHEVATAGHITAGAVCEMVHMATLVHDDVLDDADIRRRGRTINALRGNEQAVILGDFLIASAYELCSGYDSPVPARIVGEASTLMCTGELLQLHHRENASLDESTYFEILERKTAALIGAACELGALCTLGFDRRDDPRVLAVRNYGRRLGVAFQIQDDLLDLMGDEKTVGKSVRKDLEKGKLTYPLIHHLANASPTQRGETLRMLESPDRTGTDARGLLAATGSLDATRDAAHRLVHEAKKALEEGVPRSPVVEMLTLMADAVVERSF